MQILCKCGHHYIQHRKFTKDEILEVPCKICNCPKYDIGFKVETK